MLAREWLKTHTGGASFRTYRSAVESHVVPDLGRVGARNLTRSKIESWLKSYARARPPYGESTIQDLRILLGMICQYGLETGAMDRNPVREIRRGWRAGGAPRDPRKVPDEVIETEHVSAIFDCDAIAPEALLFYSLGLLAGLRFCEAAALRGGDLADAPGLRRLTVQRIWLPKDHRFADRTKGKCVRHVPVHPVLELLLKTRGPISDDELVAPYPTGGPWNDNTLRRRWRRDLATAGVPLPAGRRRYGAFHCARHSFASNLANAGADLAVIETFTHASHKKRNASCFADYLHWRWPAAVDAMLKLEI